MALLGGWGLPLDKGLVGWVWPLYGRGRGGDWGEGVAFGWVWGLPLDRGLVG